jgi:hypothetical protein
MSVDIGGKAYNVLRNVIQYYNEVDFRRMFSQFINQTYELSKNNSAFLDNLYAEGVVPNFVPSQKIRLYIKPVSANMPVVLTPLQLIAEINGQNVYFAGKQETIINKSIDDVFYPIDLIISSSPKMTIDFYVEKNYVHISTNLGVSELALFAIMDIKGDYGPNNPMKDLVVYKPISVKTVNRMDLFLYMLSDYIIDMYKEDFIDNQVLFQYLQDPLCADPVLPDMYEVLAFINSVNGITLVFSEKKMMELKYRQHYNQKEAPVMVRLEYLPYASYNMTFESILELIDILSANYKVYVSDNIEFIDNTTDTGLSSTNKVRYAMQRYNSGIIKASGGVRKVILDSVSDYLYDVSIVKNISIVNNVRGFGYLVLYIPKDNIAEQMFIDFWDRYLSQRLLFNMPISTNAYDANSIDNTIQRNFILHRLSPLSMRVEVDVVTASTDKQEVNYLLTQMLYNKYVNKIIEKIRFQDIVRLMVSGKNIQRLNSARIYLVSESGQTIATYITLNANTQTQQEEILLYNPDGYWNDLLSNNWSYTYGIASEYFRYIGKVEVVAF